MNVNAMKRRVGKVLHSQRAPEAEKGHGAFPKQASERHTDFHAWVEGYWMTEGMDGCYDGIPRYGTAVWIWKDGYRLRPIMVTYWRTEVATRSGSFRPQEKILRRRLFSLHEGTILYAFPGIDAESKVRQKSGKAMAVVEGHRS